MRNWWKIWWSEFRLKMYDVLIKTARKLRTIQVDEAIKKANAQGGYEYFGNLIIKMTPHSDGTLLALYQCQNKKFHLQHIRTEDFIHGTAMLPTADKNYPLDRITKNDSILERIGVFYKGTLPPFGSDEYAPEAEPLTPEEEIELAEWKRRLGR